MVALIAGGAAACKKEEAGGGGTDQAACGLKIGFFGALSGENAGLVTPMKNGALLAVDQYNAAHSDCTVSLVDYDSQGDPAKAPALANGAIGDTKIVAMIGPAFSGESEAANPLFDGAGLPAITPSATRPSLSDKNYKIFHRGVGNDFSQGPAAGRYIKDVMKAQKVYLIKDDSAYGIGLADEVTKILGTTQVGSDTVKTGDKVFNTLVTKVVGSGATVVFYGGYTAEASPLLKQLRAGGWKGTFVGGDGINDTNMLSATGGADVEGTVATCPCAPGTSAKGTFVTDFQTKFGQPPAVYADVAYDLANIFLEAFQAGKVTRADILSFLSTYSKAGSASGVTYKWEANGELDPAQVKVWAFIAKSGAWAPDQEIPKA